MSKKQQIQKNIELSSKLADYLVSNPNIDNKLTGPASYVVFSSTDNNLNTLNTKLITSLLNEGKKVVKAEETTSKKMPWRLTFINP